MELFDAANQWANRPADENYSSLDDMHAAALNARSGAREKVVDYGDLRVEAREGDLALVGRANVPATMTNYAFRQLSTRAGAPAGYLQELPATLAAQNLNFGLKRHPGTAALLFHKGTGGAVLRASLSEKYTRIWDHEVIERLIDFSDRHGLTPAHQTMSWSGEEVPDAATLQKALYASDHDMFAFMMSQERAIIDPVGRPLRRGVIVVNSEVGDKALKFMGFMFRDVCANHIIWGAQELAEVRIRHIGEARDAFQGAWATVRKYMDGAASIDEATMEQTRSWIGGTKDEVLDKLFGIRSLRLSRKALKASYDAVVPDEDGDPRSVWGMAQGITRHSQSLPYAETRQDMDAAAGRLLSLTF